MNKTTPAKIVEDYIKAIEFNNFQDFCNRLLIKLYPDDFTPVRAAGKWGDMKNDGYCFMLRTFFQAHASRGESISSIEKKILEDLEGCIKKQVDVKKFVYITNDILAGKVEHFIDSIRNKHKELEIETWGHLKIALLIAQFELDDIEYIIDRNLSEYKEKTAVQLLSEQLEKSEKQYLENGTKQTLLIFLQFKPDHYQQKAALIQRFNLPTSKNELLEFASYCIYIYKNTKVRFLGTDGYGGSRERLVNRAWKAKTEQALTKLKFEVKTDISLTENVEKLEIEFLKR